MDRADVVRALKCCIDRDDPCAEDCPMKDAEWKETGRAAYWAFADDHVEVPLALIQRTVELLKAQEPMVMTLEEIPERQETTGWLEWREGDFYAAILYANDLKVDYMKFCTSCAFMKKEYGVTVRCWTSRPTDAQREATPWND